MYHSIEPIRPMTVCKTVTAVRLTPQQVIGLDLAASRRRLKTASNYSRADMIREAIQAFLAKEGLDDADLS